MSLLAPEPSNPDNRRLADNIRHFQQCPQDEIRKQNACGPRPACGSANPAPRRSITTPQAYAGQHFSVPAARWEPAATPVSIAVDEAEHTKPYQADDEQKQRGLLAVFTKSKLIVSEKSAGEITPP